MSSWKNSQEEKILSDINMTPLIDIMLVLLIIFMITSSVQLGSGLDIELPDSQIQSTKTDKPIIISIEKSGRINFNGEFLSMKILEEELLREVEKSDSKEVILKGDRSVALEKLVSIMDMATRVGAKSFTIATKN